MIICVYDFQVLTKIQIDEPPTPYSYANIDDDYETNHPNLKGQQQDVSHNMEALHAKLNFEAHQQEKRAAKAVFGEGEEEPSHTESHAESFADHRAKHYNEFLVLKAMREKMAREEEEEEEDDA